ncbi:MAG: tetratricopeptide repeat protein [Salibacteraceae bacterium]|nr:tetratricopeptide repeat protein [Salibacteraceae bacterium]
MKNLFALLTVFIVLIGCGHKNDSVLSENDNFYNRADSLSKTKLDSLIRMSQHPKLSFDEKIERAKHIIINTQNDAVSLAKAYGNIGTIYSQHNQYKEAIINLEKSNVLDKNLAEPKLQAMNMYKMGLVHLKMGNNKQARQFMKLSGPIALKNKNHLLFAMIINNRGILYSKANEFDSSFIAFNKAILILDSLGLEFEKTIPLGNIGDYYLKIQEPDSAIKYFNHNLKVLRKGPYYSDQAVTLGNLGLAHRQKEHYKKALNYFKQSLRLSQKSQFFKITYDTYNDLAETYRLTGEYELAYFYKSKYLVLKDSILNKKINAEILELQQINKNEKKKKKELLQKNQVLKLKSAERDHFNQNILLSVSIILLISLLGLVFFKLKLKQTQFELIRKEQEFLQLKLTAESENVKIISHELFVKQDFSSSLIDKLDQLENISKPELKHIELFIQNELNVKSDRADLQIHMDNLSGEFYNKIKINHSNLTDSDVKFAAMIVMKMSNKEIGISKNMSTETVKTTKYRLKKKLKLSSSEDLGDYLNGFL